MLASAGRYSVTYLTDRSYVYREARAHQRFLSFLEGGSSFPKATAQQKSMGDTSGTAAPQGACYTQLSCN